MILITRSYLIIVALISIAHVYISFQKGDSPLNIFFIILLLTPLIPRVWSDLSNIKINKDGFELEKIRENVNKTIQRAAHGKTVSPQAIDELFKTVELNDWLTLVLARMLMRQGLVVLVPNHGLGLNPSLSKLTSLCHTQKLINDEEFNNLERLRYITFYAEWWAGDIPTYENWQWALTNCQSIIIKLFEKQPIHKR